MTAAGEVDKPGSAYSGSTENDEIIELTDEIIELTDRIEVAPENGDEIIELTDEMTNTDSTPLATDANSGAKQEADISDAAETDAEAMAPIIPPRDLPSFSEGEIQIGADIDDEEEIDEGEEDEFVNSLGMDLETDAGIDQRPEENESLPDASPAETAVIDAAAVSTQQIEAAIERIIMKILPEKIDSILSAAIEKTLTKEIEKIKNLILEDSSGKNV